ncbi:hypothetical protein HGRIS_013314 [Hohenbuehelia grisea]|uniref:Transmembrane protein n=1 Tax=Hohenbuehelia grisea TaxID=104357 RepID=A0ABR3IVB8_9AGAR
MSALDRLYVVQSCLHVLLFICSLIVCVITSVEAARSHGETTPTTWTSLAMSGILVGFSSVCFLSLGLELKEEERNLRAEVREHKWIFIYYVLFAPFALLQAFLRVATQGICADFRFIPQPCTVLAVVITLWFLKGLTGLVTPLPPTSRPSIRL